MTGVGNAAWTRRRAHATAAVRNDCAVAGAPLLEEWVEWDLSELRGECFIIDRVHRHGGRAPSVAMSEIEDRVARWAGLAVAYSQRHGDIVVMVSRTGLLLVRRELWRSRADEITARVRPGQSLDSVRAELMAAVTVMASAASPPVARRAARRRPAGTGSVHRS